MARAGQILWAVLLALVLALPAVAQESTSLAGVQEAQVDRVMELLEAPPERFLNKRTPETTKPEETVVEWTGVAGGRTGDGFILEVGDRRTMVLGQGKVSVGESVRVRGKLRYKRGILVGMDPLDIELVTPVAPPGVASGRRILASRSGLYRMPGRFSKSAGLAGWILDYNPSIGAAAAQEYASLINEFGASQGVDPRLVAALVAAESAFRADAVSSAGARGLGQLMPGTASGLGVLDAFDPRQNLSGATRYLSTQLRRWGGSVDLALASYNAGPGAVEQYGGVPPYQETQSYVRYVSGLYEELRELK